MDSEVQGPVVPQTVEVNVMEQQTVMEVPDLEDLMEEEEDEEIKVMEYQAEGKKKLEKDKALEQNKKDMEIAKEYFKKEMQVYTEQFEIMEQSVITKDPKKQNEAFQSVLKRLREGTILPSTVLIFILISLLGRKTLHEDIYMQSGMTEIERITSVITSVITKRSSHR